MMDPEPLAAADVAPPPMPTSSAPGTSEKGLTAPPGTTTTVPDDPDRHTCVLPRHATPRHARTMDDG